MTTILETKDLCKYYGSGATEVRALDGVNMSVESGEFVAIVGTSGSGKSTLLHMLGGLDRPTSGSVTVDGQKLFDLSDEALTIFRRRKIGFVFQAYNLVPVLSVYENIVLPLQLDGRSVDTAFLDDVVQALGLGEKLSSLPNQLSGGQQQRVAIARALAKLPRLLLCDEPTGALDYQTGKQILALLQKQSRENGMTVVIITHNSALTAMADRVIRVRSGQITDVRQNAAPVPVESIEW